jgi:hypothetical protein
MTELSSVELKLLRLLLDAGAQSGEAETARRKLLESLAKRGLSSHDLVDVLTNPGDAQAMAPPKMSKPDYGLCVMPFGEGIKGKRFMDINPGRLREIREWCLRKDAAKWASLIHNIESFLNQ